MAVAFVRATGPIVRGSGLGGRIGADDMADALSDAVDDPDVRAILFRIDSPGGSAVASETIAHQVERAIAAGKPVIVAMGNAAASGGSNLGPSNPALLEAVTARAALLRDGAADKSLPIPIDLVTASGSGLDPHISIAAAKYQAERVARLRGKDVGVIESLITAQAERPSVPGFGEPVVNVLRLNLSLDELE